MNKFFTMLLTLAALSIAIPATADECIPKLDRQATLDTGRAAYDATGGDDCATGVGQTGCDASDSARGTVGEGGMRVYFDNDACFPDHCLFSLWGFYETNGIEGLQRQSDSINADGSEGVDDTCNGAIEADLVFF